MSHAILSISGLILAIVIGVLTKVNIGLIAIGLAFIVGFIIKIDLKTIVLGWPTSLFMMIFGMNLLFSIAASNGTLKRIVEKSSNALKGHIRFLPLLLFLTTAVIAALGPGNIAMVAMMTPLALAMAKEEKISLLMVSIMVILGANAGGLSPLAPTGIIASELATKEGLQISMTLFRDMFIVSTFFGILTYIVMKGYKIPRNMVVNAKLSPPLTRQQKTTVVVIFIAIITIIFGGNIALTAFLASGCLLILRVTTEQEALAQVPWSAILLICGVALMINLVNSTEGMTIIVETLGKLTNEKTAAPTMSFLSSLMSLFSSSSGVVMPTLIPTVQGVATQAGGAVRPEPLISAIVIGSHLVSISPFSTLGALAIASAGYGSEKDTLFSKLLLSAFLYLVIGAIVSYFIVFLY